MIQKLTLENLPIAVNQLNIKLDKIERLLQEKSTQSNDQSDDPLNIKQASEFLSLSVPTLYGYVSKRIIPYSKKGKRLYFSKLELLEWLKQSRVKTKAEIEREAENHLTGLKNKGGKND